MHRRHHVLGLLFLVLLYLSAPHSARAGKYSLAYWREAAAYENKSPPAGEFGNHSAFVHVWDESGQPLGGRRIYTSWGVLLGTTDDSGYIEIELRRPNGYDFEIRDGAHPSDTTPIFSEERPPTWGHYSFEIGFMFKQNAANPGVFDTRHFGTINAQGNSPCGDLSAPHTRSLAFSSTSASNYCNDEYVLGNWTASHGQTFVATGNRVIGINAFLAAGFGVHHYWTVQIRQGGPGGTPIGPPRSSRLHLDVEYYPLLLTWGAHDVQVVPGRTYFMEFTRPQGINVFRVNRDNYGGGSYFEHGNVVPGAELMGYVLCGTFTNAGPTGGLIGFVYDAAEQPLAGAKISLPLADLYAVSAADGRYSLSSIPPGLHEIVVSREGYATYEKVDLTVAGNQVVQQNIHLIADNDTDHGVIVSPRYIRQPYNAIPAWSSSFDADWGTAATYALANQGLQRHGLQTVRSGMGSSVRTQVFPVLPNTAYQISIWARCPAGSGDFWIECGYRLGSHDAEGYDSNANAWSLVTRFSDNGPNGNGDTWTRYTTTFNSGAQSAVTMGLKMGALNSSGPRVLWDQLEVVSLELPPLVSAITESPTSIRVNFAEPVSLVAAANRLNFHLSSDAGPSPIGSATPSGNDSVILATAWQASGTDYTLTVSNVTASFQPEGLQGRNGLALVRVPVTLLDWGDAWRFHDGAVNLLGGWRFAAYDDSTWSSGPGPLGYSDDPLLEPIRTPLTVHNNRLTVYFRNTFEMPDSPGSGRLRLTTFVDDGAVFWLNGAEMFRIGVNSNPAFYFTPASRTVGVPFYEGPFDLAPTNLVSGINTLAVDLHQSEPSSPDVVFGASLQAFVAPSELPTEPTLLTIQRNNENLELRWNEPGYTLQWAPHLTGPWTDEPGLQPPVTVFTVDDARFYRLRK